MGKLKEAAFSRECGVPCSIDVLMSKMNKEDRVEFEEMLQDKAWTTASIHRALIDVYGYDKKVLALSRHRKGECRCGQAY